jgi:hypothetical protein
MELSPANSWLVVWARFDGILILQRLVLLRVVSKHARVFVARDRRLRTLPDCAEHVMMLTNRLHGESQTGALRKRFYV